jgi:anti-sigma regulatory factor (Ser/Thr protein kinase)
LRTFLALGAFDSAVPCARLHVRQVLWEWGLDALSETIELVVSELVTNAIRASEGLISSRYAGRWAPGKPPVRLWLTSDYTSVVVRVWDGNNEVPERREPALDAEGGRGLLLVEWSCDDWGSYASDGSSGKIVWAAAGIAARGSAERQY